MKIAKTVICSTCIIMAAACSSDAGSEGSPSNDSVATTKPSAPSDVTFPATIGEPVAGYMSVVDLAVRRMGDTATTYAVEQGGTIRLVDEDGSAGSVMADLSSLTRESGEQGLLGLAFSLDGSSAYVNYTDLDGKTTVDALNVNQDGSFDTTSRRTIYSLIQPYANHNGGDLIVSPDGRYLFVFNGDGGSANDPERVALDPTSDLGKIVRIDLENGDASAVWAFGLRNPWRAYVDPETEDLWVADVGQNEWEEINVVPLAESEGVSFGWSAFEGVETFNNDQLDAHRIHPEVAPIHVYPHKNNDCSISGGAVYRGTSISSIGTWYVFSDFCSGKVRALCVTDSRSACGIVELGQVENSVAVLPDANGELWVLSLSGRLVPIISTID